MFQREQDATKGTSNLEARNEVAFVRGATLQLAGCDKELFTADAISMLHEAASGALRDIDRIATAALREATRKKRKLVERDTLARIVDAELTGLEKKARGRKGSRPKAQKWR